jgi:hypothetical protein
MRALLEIFIVIALTVTTVLYFHSRQDSERIQLLVAYFSENTRDLIDERLHFLERQMNTIKYRSGTLNTRKSYAVMAHLEMVKNVMDSAQIYFRNIESIPGESGKAAAYEEYKHWITGKKSVFVMASREFEWLFNPVFGLDKGLIPEALITVNELSATNISTLMLEDALSYVVYREAESALVEVSE